MVDLETPAIHLMDADVKRLIEIKKQLSLIPSDETSFLKMESLFYDVLAMARAYDGRCSTNFFLQDFKKLFETKYRLTQEKYAKSRQRELVIKQFKIAFNEALTQRIKSQALNK